MLVRALQGLEDAARLDAGPDRVVALGGALRPARHAARLDGRRPARTRRVSARRSAGDAGKTAPGTTITPKGDRGCRSTTSTARPTAAPTGRPGEHDGGADGGADSGADDGAPRPGRRRRRRASRVSTTAVRTVAPTAARTAAPSERRGRRGARRVASDHEHAAPADTTAGRGPGPERPGPRPLRRATRRRSRAAWGRRRGARAAAELPQPFDDLLDLDAVDELLSRRGLRTPFLRMAKDGVVVPASRFTRPGGVGADDRRPGRRGGGRTALRRRGDDRPPGAPPHLAARRSTSRDARGRRSATRAGQRVRDAALVAGVLGALRHPRRVRAPVRGREALDRARARASRRPLRSQPWTERRARGRADAAETEPVARRRPARRATRCTCREGSSTPPRRSATSRAHLTVGDARRHAARVRRGARRARASTTSSCAGRCRSGSTSPTRRRSGRAAGDRRRARRGSRGDGARPVVERLRESLARRRAPRTARAARAGGRRRRSVDAAMRSGSATGSRPRWMRRRLARARATGRGRLPWTAGDGRAARRCSTATSHRRGRVPVRAGEVRARSARCCARASSYRSAA